MNLFVAILCTILILFNLFKCEMYRTTSLMRDILTLMNNYNPRQSRKCSYDVRAFEFFSFPPSILASGAVVTSALQ